jgi:hypothetical protein
MRLTLIARIPAIIVLALIGATFFSQLAVCQAVSSNASIPFKQIGFRWDWSHEHVVFASTTDIEVMENVTATPSCTSDYVVFPSGVNGSARPHNRN